VLTEIGGMNKHVCMYVCKGCVSTKLWTTRWQAINIQNCTYLFWEEYGVWIVILNLGSE
jgi:hypothetical protein